MRNFHHVVLCLAVTLLCATLSHAAEPQLTEQKVQQFCKALADSLNDHKPGLLTAAMDGDALFERSTKGLDMPADFRKGMRQGFQSTISSFGQQIVAQLQNNGHYRFLRARQVNGQWKALFRMTSAAGLNYHDMYLVAAPTGQARIIDFDVAITGEPLSQTLRHLFLPAVVSANRNMIQRLVGTESSYVTHLDDIGKVQTTAQQGHYAEAIKLFQALPEDLQHDQTLMIMGASYAMQAGKTDLYLTMLKDYATRYPDAPNADLMCLDAYFLSAQWDKAMEAVNRLDKKLGGDAYLDLYRANIVRSQGKTDQAVKLLDNVVRSDPTMPDAHYILIDIALADKKWDDLAKYIVAVRKGAGITFGDMTKKPLFAEFVKTDAYKNCVKQLAEIEKAESAND